MSDTNETTTPATREQPLEECWADQRDLEFNVAVHSLLDRAADEIDRPGPLVSIRRALGVVDEIRAKLIAEHAFRLSTPP